MALINCPECDTSISDKAPSCPKCGVVLIKKDPDRRNKTQNMGCLIVVIGMVVMGVTPLPSVGAFVFGLGFLVLIVGLIIY